MPFPCFSFYLGCPGTSECSQVMDTSPRSSWWTWPWINQKTVVHPPTRTPHWKGRSNIWIGSHCPPRHLFFHLACLVGSATLRTTGSPRAPGNCFWWSRRKRSSRHTRPLMCQTDRSWSGDQSCATRCAVGRARRSTIGTGLVCRWGTGWSGRPGCAPSTVFHRSGWMFGSWCHPVAKCAAGCSPIRRGAGRLSRSRPHRSFCERRRRLWTKSVNRTRSQTLHPLWSSGCSLGPHSASGRKSAARSWSSRRTRYSWFCALCPRSVGSRSHSFYCQRFWINRGLVQIFEGSSCRTEPRYFRFGR